MSLTGLWLGLELTRFAVTDDVADSVASSLDVIQAGAWTLSAYQGPALQPYLGGRLGSWELGVAPALAWRTEVATSEDNRSDRVRTLQGRLQARAWWSPEVSGEASWLVGLETAGSHGTAWLDGETLANGTLLWEVAPTAGARGALGKHVFLLGRARLPLQVTDGSVSTHLGGALSVEWRP
ncbi:MAG: hypothetical protein QGG40_07995 [Myxococcota bacterium]|jgi:hypothetical protein|nr:hypothetical protein [Myxococcota bacterium]